MENSTETISLEAVEQLQKAFGEFQLRADKLSCAYSAMQGDFSRINIELDQKNSELAESLVRQEQTQSYLNSILESMTNCVVAVDIAGVVTLFNLAAQKITGYSAQKIIGRHFSEVLSSTFDNQNLLAALESKGRILSKEKIIWNMNGEPITVSSQSSALMDSHGKKIGAVEIFSDLSQIKALEVEMQQNKTLAALGEMAATVAHEIRNPLGAMGVWAGLLGRDLSPDDPRRETLSKMTSALSRLNRIVSNLLVYSRPIRAQMRRIILQDLLEETINFIDIEAVRQGYNIEIDRAWSSEDLLYILADPEKMQQVIMNISLNAVQAMEDGGRLTIGCNKPKHESQRYLSFFIKDTGSGISVENIDKIFDPFHTTKENGTGLGLAIVKKFIEHHSGYITVTSRNGEGTIFNVYLPFLKDERFGD